MSVNYFNFCAPVRELKAGSGVSYWPAHTVAVID